VKTSDHAPAWINIADRALKIAPTPVPAKMWEPLKEDSPECEKADHVACKSPFSRRVAKPQVQAMLRHSSFGHGIS
jgi:hypothetical protein